MKIYVDYRSGRKEEGSIPAKRSDFNFDFLDLVDLKKLRQVNSEFYPTLCKLAKKQNGRVELNYGKSFLDMELSYISDDLTLDSSVFNTLPPFAEILNHANICTISVKDDCFVISFTFFTN